MDGYELYLQSLPYAQTSAMNYPPSHCPFLFFICGISAHVAQVLLANGKVDDAKSVIGDSKDFLKKPHVAACHILLHLLNGEVSHAVDIFNGKDVGFESSTLRSIIQTFTMPTFQAHTQHLSSFVKLVQESNAAVVNETIGPLVKDVVGDEGAETEAAQEQAEEPAESKPEANS